MLKLSRNTCGDYYTTYNNNYFRVEKGCIGWNISILTVRTSASGFDWDTFEYITTCRTLKECKETIETYK